MYKKFKIIIIIFYFFFSTVLFARTEEKTTVYLYNDVGVGKHSQLQTMAAMKEFLPSNYRIKTITAKEVILNNWVKDAALFIMPGGADLPYVKKLNGSGNQNIRNYVKNGGAYLGVCAGSYYGAAYIEFAKNSELEVVGARELGFFPGKAIGPVLAKYIYDKNNGARAAHIKLKLSNIKNVNVYYNGGGYFQNADAYKNVSILGYYENHLPAIIYISFGKGKVILSGVHFEYEPSLMNAGDEYLRKIIPAISKTNAKRKILIREILKKLAVID